MAAQNFWNGKVVIITGASSGIGRAVALHLAPRGARLGLMGRRAEVLAALAEQIRQGNAACRAAWGVCDVADAQATRTAIAGLEAQLGPCDVLIASAGIHRFTNGRRFATEEAAAVLATNLTGVVNALGAVLPGMVERRRGNLAAVSSIAGIMGLPTVAAYSASKAGVNAFCESLRVDLHPVGVTVTTICPGFVDTPMLGQRDPAKLPKMMPAAECAARIVRAIERGQAEAWFPFRTWLIARLTRFLPWSLYRRVWSTLAAIKARRKGGAVIKRSQTGASA